jgi:hypothetical protein
MLQTLQDIWFYAFIITSALLGWVWGRLRSKFQPLYEIIAGLRLERDAQARTIEFQRKVIRELEREKSGTITVYYTCPFCDVRHDTTDAAFWEAHKEVHPGNFPKKEIQ